ncbi:MAG: type II toxin-antitoxin system RelE/ParE family toxin [Magnetococcus sp. YQC-5]
MGTVTFSPASLQDLIDIGDYIAKDNRANARRFVDKLIEQCQRIEKSPLAYPRRENLVPGLRMASMGHYAIFFRVLGDVVRIERVLHGARDMTRLFELRKT